MNRIVFAFCFMIACLNYSCNTCDGPYAGPYEINNNRTFITIIPGNKKPRKVYYPLFNRRDSAYQSYGVQYAKGIPGIYLSAKVNTLEAIIQYDFEIDTVIFSYTSRIEYEVNDCSEEFELIAENIQLIYTSNDSITYTESHLRLP